MECLEMSDSESFLSAALRGLRGTPRAIPPKYLYDQLGSSLFEEICRQPEYYPTRTEIAILRSNIGEISAGFPEKGLLIELGSGASVKTEILLDALVAEGKIGAYLPFDISRDFLVDASKRLQKKYPGLRILPIWGDFTAEVRLPGAFSGIPERTAGQCLAFLPGSTLGNFDPPDALRMLRSVGKIADRFLIGIDLEKDPDVLEAAYNDAAGITARFNKNLLTRLAREGGARLDPEDFFHEAFYRDSMRRIEMHLVAQKRVRMRIGEEEFRLSPGETIHTENSYKYTLSGFESLARHAGFDASRRWSDPKGWFAVFLLEIGQRCS